MYNLVELKELNGGDVNKFLNFYILLSAPRTFIRHYYRKN